VRPEGGAPAKEEPVRKILLTLLLATLLLPAAAQARTIRLMYEAPAAGPEGGGLRSW
jgi:hypothetical protein